MALWLPLRVASSRWPRVGWVQIGRNARWWGYAERDEDLYVRHGVMFRSLVVVPYGRMQYVDVQAGPLEQLFRIASVHLHTASPGTSARIPGLSGRGGGPAARPADVTGRGPGSGPVSEPERPFKRLSPLTPVVRSFILVVAVAGLHVGRPAAR